METLIGILLYIGAISTNITYTTQEINDIADQNATTVTQVENDPQQMSEVNQLLNGVTIEYKGGGDKLIIYEEIDI